MIGGNTGDSWGKKIKQKTQDINSFLNEYKTRYDELFELTRKAKFAASGPGKKNKIRNFLQKASFSIFLERKKFLVSEVFSLELPDINELY